VGVVSVYAVQRGIRTEGAWKRAGDTFQPEAARPQAGNPVGRTTQKSKQFQCFLALDACFFYAYFSPK